MAGAQRGATGRHGAGRMREGRAARLAVDMARPDVLPGQGAEEIIIISVQAGRDGSARGIRTARDREWR
jgi:hypothetical protein